MPSIDITGGVVEIDLILKGIKTLGRVGRNGADNIAVEIDLILKGIKNTESG